MHLLKGMFARLQPTEKKIKGLQDEVDELQRELNIVMIKIKQTFKMGLEISQEQVNDLFAVITGTVCMSSFALYELETSLRVAHHITRSQSVVGMLGKQNAIINLHCACLHVDGGA